MKYWDSKLVGSKIELRPCKRHWSEISYINFDKNLVVQSKEKSPTIEVFMTPKERLVPVVIEWKNCWHGSKNIPSSGGNRDHT